MAYQRKASASQINLYNQCPYKWYLKYIQKEKEPITEALIKGSLCHAVIEKFHSMNPRQCPINLKNYSTEFYTYADSLLDEIAHNEKFVFGRKEQSYFNDLTDILNSELKAVKEIEDVRKMIHHYIQLFIWGFEQYSDKLGANFPMSFYMSRVKFSELELSEDDFIGYIDQVIESDGKIIITDIKTSKVYKLGFDESYRRQTMLYAYKYYKLRGVMPDYTCVFYVRSGIQAYYEVNKETLTDECEKILDDFFKGTQSTDPEDYTMNCANNFCTCSLSSNPSKDWCKFRCFCEERIKKGSLNLIKASPKVKNKKK